MHGHQCELRFTGTSTGCDFLSVPWASYQIGKIAVRMRLERFPDHRLQRKPLVSDPGMHHGTCVTYVPWCMSGSLTRDGGENVPGISGACANRNFTYLARDPWLQRHLAIHPCPGVIDELHVTKKHEWVVTLHNVIRIELIIYALIGVLVWLIPLGKTGPIFLRLTRRNWMTENLC